MASSRRRRADRERRTLPPGWVAPIVARRRALLGTALVVVLSLALTIGLALLTRFGPSWLDRLSLVIFLGAFVPVLAPLLCQEIGVAETGRGGWLTVTTVTGRRSVDLSRLVQIRHYFVPGKFGTSIDLLIVRDINHVRVGLVSSDAHAAVQQALRRKTPGFRPPKISRSARRDLDGQYSILFDFFVPLLLVCAWVLAVLAVCFPLALA